MITYKQLSLAEIFEDCQNKLIMTNLLSFRFLKLILTLMKLFRLLFVIIFMHQRAEPVNTL